MKELPQKDLGLATELIPELQDLVYLLCTVQLPTLQLHTLPFPDAS